MMHFTIVNCFHSLYKQHLIGTNELKAIITNPQLIHKTRILDSTLYNLINNNCISYLPNDVREIKYIFPIERIPYSQLFDIEEISDKSNLVPYMMPNEDYFIQQMKKLDIRKSDNIICYDRHGMFTAPRVWFTLKMFGHNNVRVLNGGYPKWKNESQPIEEYSNFSLKSTMKNRASPLKTDYDYKKEDWRVLTMKKMLKIEKSIKQKKLNASIIDARPEVRFKMLVDEPTKCNRRGRLEGAINIPIQDLVDADNCFKKSNELFKAFQQKGVNIKDPMYLYCGCGLSALVDILALSILGKFNNCKLYDGSWTEIVSQILFIIREIILVKKFNI